MDDILPQAAPNKFTSNMILGKLEDLHLAQLYLVYSWVGIKFCW